MKKVIKKLAASLGYEINKRAAASPPVDLPAKVCRRCGVDIWESIAADTYLKQLAPLADPPVPVTNADMLKHYAGIPEAVDNNSMRNYFRAARENGVTTVTDVYPGSHFYSRQRMLHTIYRHAFGETLKGVSVLDIGCSSGYYSFFCAREGAAPVLGIDARPEHEDQFNMLHAALKMPNTCQYRNVDMEKELDTLDGAHDLVLAQGVMYHVYDHLTFVKNLYRLTGKVLILEGECSGHLDNVCTAFMEDVTNLRASIHGPAIFPSVSWMIALLRWAGFKKVSYVRYPADLEDRAGFSKLTRAMLVAEKG